MEYIDLLKHGGMIATLLFVIYRLEQAVKYLSTELRDEIKKNDAAIVESYEKHISDLKEETQMILENDKCNKSN